MVIKQSYINAGLIIILAATSALVVRLIIYPNLSINDQILLFLTSIVLLGLYLLGFYFINHLFDKYYPFSKSVAGRITTQIITGIIYVFLIRSFLFHQFADKIPFVITPMFKVAVYIVDLATSIALNIGFFADHFFTQWKKSIERAERLEKEKAIVQFDNLKNQLNPHFLFNSLTSLNSLIFEDQNLASQFLKHLSKVYRYLLENKEIVSLRKELDFLENYKFLMMTRYAGSLVIERTIIEEVMDSNIIPVTLQNLIENAIKHNIINENNPLKILIYNEENYLCISNNLQRKRIVENSNKQGLENLKNLYRFLSPHPVVIIESSYAFTVKIPFIDKSQIS